MDSGSTEEVERHTCVRCGKPYRYVTEPKTIEPGDIYSAAGMRETAISGLCEYCFDEITLIFEEGDIDNLPGSSDQGS